MRGAAASVGAAVLGGMDGAAGTAGLALVDIMAVVGLALAADPTEEVGQAVAGMRVVGIPAEDMGAEDMGAEDTGVEDTGVEDMAVAATVIASASYRPQRSCAGAVLRPERWFRLP
jgi:hypothetical protein